MTQNLVATASSDLVTKITNAYTNFFSIVYIIPPVGILIWAFTTSLSYSKENETYHSNIEDSLDGRAFKQIVVPLYEAITSNLLDETYEQVKGNSLSNKKEFIRKYELEKNTLLKKRDFSLINEADNFNDTITSLIKSKKNQLEFKNLVANNINILNAIVFVSFIDVLAGFAIVFFQNIYYSAALSSFSLIALLIMFAIMLILLGLYKHNESCIASLKYE